MGPIKLWRRPRIRILAWLLGSVAFAVVSMGFYCRELAKPLRAYYETLRGSERTLPPPLSAAFLTLLEPEAEFRSQVFCLALEALIRGKWKLKGKDYQVHIECLHIPVAASNIVHGFWNRSNRARNPVFYALAVDAVQITFAPNERAAFAAHFFTEHRSLSQASLNWYGLQLSELSVDQFLTLMALENSLPQSEGLLAEVWDDLPDSEWQVQSFQATVASYRRRVQHGSAIQR